MVNKKKYYTLKVFMNHLGSYYLYDAKSQTKLYFQQSPAEFNFLYLEGSHQSLLKYFFIALPSLPFSKTDIYWEDNINPRFRKKLLSFLFVNQVFFTLFIFSKRTLSID